MKKSPNYLFKKPFWLFFVLLGCFSLFFQCKHKPDPQPEPNNPVPTDPDSCLVAPVVSFDTVVHAACGNSEGFLVVSGSSGSGSTYMYSIDGTNFQESDTFANLTGGVYTVTVMDSAGCTGTSDPVSIVNITGISFDVSSTTATCSSNNGTVTLENVSGGVPPYTYSIEASSYSTDTVFSSLGVGSYQVNVKDSTGCVAYKIATVADDGNVTFTVDSTSPDCGLSNGQMIIHATSGDAPFQFSINNGSSFQSDSLFTNIGAGTYSLVVQDSNGCQKASSISIVELSSDLSFSYTDNDATCGSSDGSVTLTGENGAGGYTFSFNGAGFSGTTTYSSLAGGTYTVIVKDANGCEYTDQVIVGNQSVSYSSDVAPIISSTCSTTLCHGNPTASKPNLSTWSAASSVAAKIKFELESGSMPKTGSISAQDKAKIICWVDQGAPNN